MIGDVRSGTDNEEVHAMLDIRQGLAKTSTENTTRCSAQFALTDVFEA